MKLGRIDGKVWAATQDPRLKGLRLQILQPINENEQPEGDPFIAVDDIGVSEGDLVYWVNSTEAGFLLPDRVIPSEISIVGVVDRLDVGLRLDGAVDSPPAGAGEPSRRAVPGRRGRGRG
jgi:microcompartment protein CcmK/EutM